MGSVETEIKKIGWCSLMISVIIVSYNVSSYLRECIKTLTNSIVNSDLEIIVVDNYSYDNSVKMVTSEFPEVKVIANEDNCGYAKAVNQGISRARGDFICLLNPDTMVKNNTISTLYNYLLNNTDTGVVGCKVLDSDGNLQLASRRSFPSMMTSFTKYLGLNKIFPSSRYFGQYNQTYVDENIIQEVDAISGACMMFSRKLIEHIGLMDEQYFMYFEDTDFCFRAKKSGFKVIYNPETQIIHYKGESCRKAPFNVTRKFHEAMILFFQKYKREFPFWRSTKILLKSAIILKQCVLALTNLRSTLAAGIMDVISIISSFILAVYIWYPIKYQININGDLIIKHWPLLVCYLIIWMSIVSWIKLYQKNSLSYGRSLVVSALAFFLSATATYFISIFAYSRGVLLIASIFTGVITAGWRIIIHYLHRYTRISSSFLYHYLFTRRGLILGYNSETIEIERELVQSPNLNYDIIGFVDNQIQDNNNHHKFLGRIDDIQDLIQKYHVNEIIIPESTFSVSEIIDIIQKIKQMKVSYKFIPSDERHLIGKGTIEKIGGMQLVEVDFILFDQMHAFFKRAFDVIVSGILILCISPIHLYYRLFSSVNNVNIWGKNSNKITIIQYPARFTWVRELGLLFSVFIGNLSFVGSRIVPLSEKDPKLLIKPGITGLSQQKKVELDPIQLRSFDEYYIQNYSFVFDLEIILKSLLKI